jgi:hypothetical protein
MLQFVAKRCFKSQEEANGCAELTAGGAGKAERTKRRARGFKRSSAQDEGRQSDLAGERQRRHESSLANSGDPEGRDVLTSG